MNNNNQELTYLKRQLMRYAKYRYCRFIFRYGFLIGWMVVPLASILFIPAMRVHQQLLSVLIIVIVLGSRLLASTRIIGELAVNAANSGGNIEPEMSSLKAERSVIARPGFIFYILIFPVALIWVWQRRTDSTWSSKSLGEITTVESMWGIYTAITAIVVGALGTICIRNQPYYGKLMSFGGELALGLFVMIFISFLLNSI